MKNNKINKNFNLFKLSYYNTNSPNSWLWCGFYSQLLKDKYLEKLKKENQTNISQILSKKLKCGKSTIEKYLIRLKKAKKICTLPIKFVGELSYYLNPTLKREINGTIISLHFKNKKSKQIKAIHRLSKELAEFIGAFVADGYFNSCNYYINISEGHKDSLILLQKKIKNIFNFEPTLRFSSKDNTWRLWIKNRVICRYFENIFDFKPGKKAETVCMPELIRTADFSIQKAFVRGVLTFDGGIKTNGNVAFCTRSKALMEDVKIILNKDKLNYNTHYNSNKKAWNLESNSGRDKKLLLKWKEYFFSNTIKHNKIKFFLGEFKISNLQQLEKLFPRHHHSKISFRDIYNSIKKIQSGEINDLIRELKNNNINIANTTAYKYLHILTNFGLITKDNYQIKTNKNAFYKTKYSLQKEQDLINKKVTQL